MTTRQRSDDALVADLKVVIGELERNGGWANATPVLREAADRIATFRARVDLLEGLLTWFVDAMNAGMNPEHMLFRANRDAARAALDAAARSAEPQADKTYVVLADLHEQASGHKCNFGCDSPYPVNCNCQGKCPKHATRSRTESEG